MENAEFSEIKYKIQILAIKNKDSECLLKCTELIEEFNESKIEDNNLMWFLSYHKALMEYRLNKFRLAIDSINISLNYVNEVELNKEGTLSMLMLAACYERFNKINDAKKIYKQLSKYCKRCGYINLRICCIFSMACINNDFGKINKIMNMAEYIMYIPNNDVDLDKITLLKQMYLSVERLNIS